MITFLRFSRSMGNLGNQLFQYASLIGFKTKHSCELVLPKWKYAEYFESPPAFFINDPKPDVTVEEGPFHYSPLWFDQYADDFRNKTVNINGWLQSEKYFDHCKLDVRDALKFKESFVIQLQDKIKGDLTTRPIIGISIRRGDYVLNPSYDLLPIQYYIGALLEHFPKFREDFNILIFSDDYDYCRLHFRCLTNAYYADGLNAIEQLCVGARLCQHYIIANSTFSWWMAWLGTGPDTEFNKVIRPGYLFAGKLLERNNDCDFWPERWTRYDHKNNRINLRDVTFTIPVKRDTQDREENLQLNMMMLHSIFDTNVITGEQGGNIFENYSGEAWGWQYVKFDMQHFHRTKMLNDMAKMASTDIIVNWDADVLVPPMQIIESVRLIKQNLMDCVYPYDGRFARVPRKPWLDTMQRHLDIGMFGATYFPGMGSGPLSVGGAVMWRLSSFIDIGMENENMISYAPEDTERYERAQKLGLRVHRMTGVLYHLDHVLSLDSTTRHGHYPQNKNEYKKISGMSPEELKAYVSTWPWRHHYNQHYYDQIVPEAVSSRDAVFKILFEWGILRKGCQVIDVGCGVGAWGKDAFEKYGIRYDGIDHDVPADKLVISPDQYTDMDLRGPIMFPAEASRVLFEDDVALCLETAEHLEEEHADWLVRFLCELANTIVFSAAIPGQGGMGHVNEQWQGYWGKKFESHRYYPWPYGDIRRKIHEDESVGLWYRQNLVIYCRMHEVPKKVNYQLDFVHPKMYENLILKK